MIQNNNSHKRKAGPRGSSSPAQLVQRRLLIPLAAGGLVIVVIIAMGFLAWKSCKDFEKTVVSQTQQQLMTIATTESQHIERRIIDTHDKLRVLAENPKIKEALKTGRTDKDGPVVDGYHPEKLVYEHLMNDISSLYLLDNKGIIQNRFPWKKGKAGNDYSLKPGIRMVLKNHRPYVSELFKTNSGKDCISICYPVFDQKQFVGILRAVVDLQIIHACLKDSDIGSKGYAWMIDGNGKVISHPESRYIGKNLYAIMKKRFFSCDWAELQNITKKMIKGEKGTGFYCSISTLDKKHKDTKKITSFVPVKIINKRWSLGTVMDYDEISGPVKVHTRNVSVGMAFFMLFIFGTGLWYFRIQKKNVKLTAKAESAEELQEINQQLNSEITERKRVEESLQEAMAKSQESVTRLEQFNRLAVGREHQMIELKCQINELAGELGKSPLYDLSFLQTAGEQGSWDGA